jgi:cell division septation protein DedD
MRLLLTVLLASTPIAGPVHAQQGQERLGETERLIENQRYAEARETLAGFWSQGGETAQGDTRARALYLRSVLAESLDDAERDLLRIAIEHPHSVHADRALFRLAQARTARGDEAGASVYLERLVRDYPMSSLRTSARAMLGLSAEAPASAPAAPARVAARQPSPAPAAQPRSSSGAPAASAVPLSVQVGQFATVAEAEVIRDRVRAAGFRPYLARVGQSGTTVVRVGQFTDRAAAEAMARRVSQAGFAAQVTAVYAN